MNPNEVRQIRIGSHKVGIIGLEVAVRDLANKKQEMTDEEIQNELLTKLSKRNYISENVKPEYGKAFLNEYKKFVGDPVNQDRLEDQMEIKILGRGCNRCEQLMQEVLNVVSELKLRADVEHIKDIRQIAEYGVVGTPTLLINGRIKSMGQIPSKQKIMLWLKG